MMRKHAIMSVNIAVLLFGLAGLFAKWIHLPAICITFGRVLFSSVALGLYMLIRKQFPADEERLAPADSCRSDSRSALVVISRIDPAFYRGCRNHHILFFSPVCDIP